MLFRRIVRHSSVLVILLLSCAFSLFLVMRGPLSKFTAGSEEQINVISTTMPEIPDVNDAKLYDVKSVLLKSYDPSAGHNIKIGELVGKILITEDNSSVLASYNVPSRDQSKVKHYL